MVILGVEFFSFFFLHCSKTTHCSDGSRMIPLLPVWIISSFCACVLSYCLSFLPLRRKWSATKGFLNFCVAICLITTGKPGIGTGNQVPDCPSVQRCKHLITGAEGHNFNMCTHTHTVLPARCNIVTVVDHSGAHSCMFILWLKGVLIYVFLYYTFMKH